MTIFPFIGRGKSKKEAKRLAAHQMWQRLQDLPVDNQEDVTDEVGNFSDKCYINRVLFSMAKRSRLMYDVDQ